MTYFDLCCFWEEDDVFGVGVLDVFDGVFLSGVVRDELVLVPGLLTLPVLKKSTDNSAIIILSIQIFVCVVVL